MSRCTSVRTSRFQFTHPGGVRPTDPLGIIFGNLCFNSRTREGCDQFATTSRPRYLLFQFTHPGGVRHAPRYAEYKTACDVSIHAPGRGATKASATMLTLLKVFQFTHPGGVRRSWKIPSRRSLSVSIHAPGRGATYPGDDFVQDLRRFNSRTREGCDVIA